MLRNAITKGTARHAPKGRDAQEKINQGRDRDENDLEKPNLGKLNQPSARYLLPSAATLGSLQFSIAAIIGPVLGG